MSVGAVLGAALLLGAPSPFGEVPFRPAGGAATCLRATGYPGEVVRSTSLGAQFLSATPNGLAPVAEVTPGTSTSECPEAAAQPSGTGVVAFAGVDGVVRAALREPGSPWGEPVEVATAPEFSNGHPLAAAVSERGDALVAFAGGARQRYDVRAVRRAPGAAFAAAETLFSAPKRATARMRVAAGVSATGEAVVAWSFQPASGQLREVWAATAQPGGAFAPAAKVGTMRAGAEFVLAVGAGGHALLAFAGGADVLVAERAPGAAGFGAPVRIGASSDPTLTDTAAAVRPDGGAVVAWVNFIDGDVHAVVRAQAGEFTAPLPRPEASSPLSSTLAPKRGLHLPKRFLVPVGNDVGDLSKNAVSPDDEGGVPRAAILPDGRALVTWAGAAQYGDLWWTSPLSVTLPLAGGPAVGQTFGADLRPAGTVTPVVQADGGAAIVWVDNDAEHQRDGRLHLALEGAADAAEPAPPELRVSAPKRRVLKADEDLRFRVRCSSACDVRAQLGTGVLAPDDERTLTRAGETELRLRQLVAPLASLRGGPVTIRLRYGAPGTRHATGRSVTFRLRRLPDAPRPRVLDAAARRVGDEVVVTWRSDRDARASNFFAYGTANRSTDSGELYGNGDVTGRGRRFRIRLKSAEKARYVQIVAQAEGARKTDLTTVRIRT